MDGLWGEHLRWNLWKGGSVDRGENINDGTWYMYYRFKHERRAGYAVSADGLHWEAQNRSVIEGDDPQVLEIDDDFYLLFFCPSEYPMGHEPGCDIRVAMLEGNLSDLASTAPEPNC